MRALFFAFVILDVVGAVAALGACSSSSSSSPPPDAGPDVANSTCGHPGDQGNAVGVGKFCTVPDDCKTGSATLCSAIANGTELSTTYSYFCTLQCNPTKPEACGEGATCACTSIGCGCAPLGCAIDSGTLFDAGADTGVSGDGGAE